ncbi:MAG: SDR family NAD(P)-dependent oxidoreductase, partial [Actinomycetota bacterium]|nr:SDR family NAD(P)-dependent oxidoreductase [Actinomycetota bacterium]
MSRAILVTGSSRGIGAAIAKALAGAGHRVAVHAGRDIESAERVRSELRGDGHVVVAGDLADSEACRRVVGEAIDGLGDLDVLVNNAGIFV